jgi:hypothetical protein
MPGPLVGYLPYGWRDPNVLPDGDPHGFGISEYEQVRDLGPGLQRAAERLFRLLGKLAAGRHELSRNLLSDNPYFPPALARKAAELRWQREVLIVPLALSRTQDDKGRVRWTLFGGSEQGPACPFWHSFRSDPDSELPADAVRSRLEQLLGLAGLSDLPGLRILPAAPPDANCFPNFGDERIPRSLHSLLVPEDTTLDGVRILLTFRPFAQLPPRVQTAVLEGKLLLLPSPASLIFFGHRGYHQLARQLPHAVQLALLHQFHSERAAVTGIRISQSGWISEPRQKSTPALHPYAQVRNHVKRTHRWNRVRRNDDENLVLDGEERVAHVLFGTDPETLGLYGKPMMRNAQLWTTDYRLLLDGPRASRDRIDEAALSLRDGGHFGYRFFFPPMRVGRAEVYWHLPLCASALSAKGEQEPLDLQLLPLRGGFTGFLTADAGHLTLQTLWPRLLCRPGHTEAAELLASASGNPHPTAAHNARKLLSVCDLLDIGKLPASLARCLIDIPHSSSFGSWVDGLPEHAPVPARGQKLRELLRKAVAPPAEEDSPPPALTFAATATRSYEERYYQTIAKLCNGTLPAQNTADPVRQAALPGSVEESQCDLPAVGDFLHQRYKELIEQSGMRGKAVSANHWFRWRTECDLIWSEGWSRNQTGRSRERNILMIIPGQDRSQAVLLADHYDTAYMEDIYEPKHRGGHIREAAAGADDNHSATAALLLAAETLLPLSRAGMLRHDVWLVHLTGEEFPADCLGARNLVQRLVEGNLAVEVPGQGFLDLSEVRVRAAYIMDMVAHNDDKDRYVFQIAPGKGPDSLRAALIAHRANERWNQSIAEWNRAPERQSAGPSQRLDSGKIPPPVAHPRMSGEIRPHWHWKSCLFNTDAQIFADAGIPVVLLMENYDINRHGYHDALDTLINIDLDYGAALTAIAIETVAMLACEQQ